MVRPVSAARHGQAPLPFVGRERELAILRDALAGATRGQGGCVLVAGEPGIGKTRLVAELAAEARRGGRLVLAGRAYESDLLPPYMPLLDALTPYVRRTDAEALRAQLGAGAGEVALLLPEIRARLGAKHQPAAPSENLDRARLFTTLSTFLLEIARAAGGALLSLDDLHWADATTLLFLRELVTRLPDSALLVCGTYRDTETGPWHPLSPLLAELTRGPRFRRIPLDGLGAADVARVIQGSVGAVPADALVRAVAGETGGNPLFVGEVARLLAAEGQFGVAGDAAWWPATPRGVREVIGRRLERLPQDTGRVLSIAAILGREFSVTELERVSEVSGEALLEALEAAEHARLIVPAPGAPGRFGFAHPLIRETAYGQIPSTRRVRLHRQIGHALEDLYATDLDAHLTELAYHFYQAAPSGEQATAISYARKAGQRALALLAYEEAVTYTNTAIALAQALVPPAHALTAALMLTLAEAQTRAGDYAAGKESFGRAAALAQRAGARETLAHAALGYSGYRGVPGLVDEHSVRLLEEAQAALAGEASALEARVLARLAMELYYGSARTRREDLSTRALAIARGAGDPAALAAVLVGRHYALHEPDNVAERLSAATELVQLAETAGDREVALQGHYLRLFDVLELGEADAIVEEIAAHARLSATLRQPLYTWRTLLLEGMHAILEGRYEAGENLARQAYAGAVAANIPNAAQAYGGQLNVIRWDQGRIAENQPMLEASAAQFPANSVWRAVLALIHREKDHPDLARAQLTALAAGGFASIAHDENWPTVIACCAEVCASLEDVTLAEPLYALLLPLAERTIVVAGGVGSLGAAARHLGQLATTLGRWEDAAAHFATATAINRRLNARPWLARTYLDEAALLLRWRPPGALGRARALAESALREAEALGMARIAAGARALLESTSAPADHANTVRFGVLTAREVDVLRLLVEGRTNREIAARLVLSTRTVDHHIAKIYRKVGARRRADAAAYAMAHGIISAPGSD